MIKYEALMELYLYYRQLKKDGLLYLHYTQLKKKMNMASQCLPL